MKPANAGVLEAQSSWRISPVIAFTLVELLAVIAVVGILAALAASAVSGALHKARETRCRSNLKQLSTAMASYVGSHGEYPQRTNPEIVEGTTNAWLWPHLLEREMTSSDQHLPPRFRGNLENSVWDCPAEPPGQAGVHFDYGYNLWGLTSDLNQAPLGLGGKIRAATLVGSPEPSRIPVKEGEVLRPSRMLAFGDGVSGWGDFLWKNSRFSREKPSRDRRDHLPFNPSRHRRRANAVFADGHAETLSLATLFADVSEESLSWWNRDNQPHRERLAP